MSNSFDVGDLVSLNEQPDAAVFRVVDIGTLTVALVDQYLDLRGLGARTQWVDISLPRRASDEQIANMHRDIASNE